MANGIGNKPSYKQLGVQLIAVVIYLASWVLLWAKAETVRLPIVDVKIDAPPELIIVGASLGLIALLAFYSFYIATDNLDVSMRTAIAATLLIFFVAASTYLIAVPALVGVAAAQDLFASLTGFMSVILAFYFAATAAEKVAQVAKDASVSRAKIQAGWTNIEDTQPVASSSASDPT